MRLPRSAVGNRKIVAEEGQAGGSSATLGLGKMEDQRYHSTQYQEDAHQIVEDLGEDHNHDTEYESDYPSDQQHVRS
jgi:hypothetical protein